MTDKKLFNSKLTLSSKLNEMLNIAEEKYDKKVTTFIQLLAFTGMRLLELHNLKFSDFNEAGNIILIGKCGKREIVLIEQAKIAVALLKRDYPNNVYLFQSPNIDNGAIPLSPHYLSNVFRKIADINKSSIKVTSFRKSLVTNLMTNDLNESKFFI